MKRSNASFLASYLRDSPTLKRLLRFLVEETLAGREDTLKEYNIGTLVFQRGEFYDPKSESIVRAVKGDDNAVVKTYGLPKRPAPTTPRRWRRPPGAWTTGDS